MISKPLRIAWHQLIASRVRQVPFWVLLGFLPTYLIERLVVTLDPTLFLDVRGVHVHHFTYGVFILAIVGFVSLVSPKRAQPWLAFVYGAGLALAFDEFGMWIQLTSNYNLDQSEDVMTGILIFLVFVVYFFGLLKRAWPLLKRR